MMMTMMIIILLMMLVNVFVMHADDGGEADDGESNSLPTYVK